MQKTQRRRSGCALGDAHRAVGRVDEAKRRLERAGCLADQLEVGDAGCHVVRPDAIGLAGAALVEADDAKVLEQRCLDRIEDRRVHRPVRAEQHRRPRASLLPVELDAVWSRDLGHGPSLGGEAGYVGPVPGNSTEPPFIRGNSICNETRNRNDTFSRFDRWVQGHPGRREHRGSARRSSSSSRRRIGWRSRP